MYGVKYAYYKSYILLGSKLFDDELKKYETSINDKENSIREQGLAKILMHSFNKLIQDITSKKYPNYFRTSTFLFLFSAFEGDIVQLCNLLQEISSKKNEKILSLNETKGAIGNIGKSKFFFKNNFSIEVETELWSRVENFQVVRNAITHDDSMVIKDKINVKGKKSLLEIIETNPYLEYDEDEKFFLINSNKFLFDFCSTSERYLKSIFNAGFSQLISSQDLQS